MTILIFSIAGGLFILLVLVSAVKPKRATASLFELRRRQRLRDNGASEELRRQALLTQAAALSWPIRAVLLVLLTALFIYLMGWAGGLLIILVICLIHDRIAQIAFISKLSNRIYNRNERTLLGLVSKYKKPIRLIGGKRILEERIVPLGSKEEFTHLLELSPIFSEGDKRILEKTLRFKERTVKELMIPRNKVITVADSELLGPLVLHDLHKTGHTIFPVIKGDAVVGLLDSTDHFDLHTKESVHVRSVMHSDVTEVDEGASLNEALRALLSTKEQLLIVVNDDGKMTGIVSLKDIVRAIVG